MAFGGGGDVFLCFYRVFGMVMESDSSDMAKRKCADHGDSPFGTWIEETFSCSNFGIRRNCEPEEPGIDGDTGRKTENGKEYDITYQKGVITINDIIKDGILTQKDFVNAGNKKTTCNTAAEVEVYKDSDFVYCYKVHKDSLGCLTKEYKSTIKGDYAIDTCEWK